MGMKGLFGQEHPVVLPGQGLELELASRKNQFSSTRRLKILE